MIACVAIIGAANNPLYLRTFQDDDDLTFHHIVHVALDFIEEKLQSSSSSTAQNGMYLGFLSPLEDHLAYGYVTNSNVKLIAALQEHPARESELRTFFAQMHTLYVNVISNPFTAIGERIVSSQLEQRIYSLVMQYNHTANVSSNKLSASAMTSTAAANTAIASSV